MNQNKSKIKRDSSNRWLWLGVCCAILLVGGYLAASRTRSLPAFWRIPAPHPKPTAARDAQWQQDLHYLAHELPRLHVNAFHNTSEADFTRAVADLETAIPALSDREITIRFVQLVTMLGDAHTRTFPVNDTQFMLCPLQLYWFEDGVYVINTTPDYREALYTRVVAIDSVAVEDAATALTPLVAHENEAGLKQRITIYLASPSLMHTLGLTSSPTRGQWQLERADGTRFTQDVAAIPAADYMAFFGDPANVAQPDQLPLYRQNRADNYWFEYLETTQTLYFQFNRCAEMEMLPFKHFNEALFDFIDAHPVERLIIDIRDNGGGDSSLLAPFITQIKEHPLNRQDALFVIVGRGTFSSAILNALKLAQETEATFVGEPTSGSPAHYGEVQSFILPNSRMQVNYSTKYFSASIYEKSKMTTGELLGAFGYYIPHFPVAPAPTRTFEPHIYIAPTGADYAAGRDPVVTYILNANTP